MSSNTVIKSAMLSTGKDDWETPPEFFAACEKRYGKFDLDACASSYNTKCPVYISDDYEDALSVKWEGHNIWMNPPYSRGKQSEFIYKALKTSLEPGFRNVVCLIPVRTGTKIWQDVIFKYAAEILFIRGRLKFVGAKDSAPFESAIVVFSSCPPKNPYIQTWSWREERYPSRKRKGK